MPRLDLHRAETSKLERSKIMFMHASVFTSLSFVKSLSSETYPPLHWQKPPVCIVASQLIEGLKLCAKCFDGLMGGS